MPLAKYKLVFWEINLSEKPALLLASCMINSTPPTRLPLVLTFCRRQCTLKIEQFACSF
ncbi:hypothetical protein HAX54_021288, partial [Datura stramonium]|nr:hypothetical protein [Datura stramonium]